MVLVNGNGNMIVCMNVIASTTADVIIYNEIRIKAILTKKR